MRHCNWIRFVKASTNIDDVNIVAVTVKNEPIFQAIKDIKPNDEIVVFFETDKQKVKANIVKTEPNEVPEQEKSPESTYRKNDSIDSNDMVSPASIGHRGLITSPLSRDDDCISSVSDVTSESEESFKIEQVNKF